jgi:excisionase family DNA binding protein
VPNNNNWGENPMKSDAIAPKDVARLKGWTLKYVYDLLAAGRIRGARKVGKQWCIPAAALTVLDGTRRCSARRRPRRVTRT